MCEIDLNWLESALKSKYDDITKLISTRAEPAVSDGENYVSRIYRVSAKALSPDGLEKNLSLILKRKLSATIDHNPSLQNKLDSAFNIEYDVSSIINFTHV